MERNVRSNKKRYNRQVVLRSMERNVVSNRKGQQNARIDQRKYKMTEIVLQVKALK